MKISDIVKTSATFLGREDVVDYLSNEGEDVSENALETIDLLTRLSNLVISELAEGLILLKREVRVDGVSSVNFAEVGISPLDIIAIYDDVGNKLEHKLTRYEVAAVSGLIYKLEYSYLPEKYSLNDMVGEFVKPVTVGILSYGVLAEYCITQARFEEAVMWNERYVDGIKGLIKPKNGKMKGRKFV